MDQEPEVTRYLSGPWSDPVAHRAFVEDRTRGPYPDGLGYWTIAPGDRPTEFVGWVLLIPLDAVGPEIEIGWRLRPAFWRLGYATEAASAVLRHGYGKYDIAPRLGMYVLDGTGRCRVPIRSVTGRR